MNETTASASPARPDEARTGRARALARLLGADAVGLVGVLLETVDLIGGLVSIKELPSGRYVHVNDAMAGLLGRSAADLAGRFDIDLLSEGPAATVRSAEQAAMASSDPTASEHRLELDGRKRDFSVTRTVLPRADEQAPRHLLAVWIEQTDSHERELQLRQALAQLEQQQVAGEAQRRETQDVSLRDAVTGLFREVHFGDQLRREVDLSSREHREFALVSIALDPLSDAVAGLGNEARMRVLEALGRLLRSNTRAMDASCRLEADRFAVLLSGVGLATAHSRMEGLRRQCATQIVVLEGRELGFTVSMGVASFPHTAHTEQGLLDAADLALGEAQKRGRNQVALASIRFEADASARFESGARTL